MTWNTPNYQKDIFFVLVYHLFFFSKNQFWVFGQKLPTSMLSFYFSVLGCIYVVLLLFQGRVKKIRKAIELRHVVFINMSHQKFGNVTAFFSLKIASKIKVSGTIDFKSSLSCEMVKDEWSSINFMCQRLMPTRPLPCSLELEVEFSGDSIFWGGSIKIDILHFG